MTGFIYPDTVRIRRPKVDAPSQSIGDGGYSALRGPEDERWIWVGPVKASVQLSGGGRGPAGVPTDPGRASVTIMIPRSAGIPRGTLKDADHAIDQDGRRYQLSNVYWTALGWRLTGTEMTV